MIEEISATITTAADGSATVYLSPTYSGRVHALKYAPGTIATGAGLTITGETTAVPILIKASAGTSTVWYYPRAFPNQNTDGAAEADATCDIYIVKERIKVVVASGGSGGVGTITAYIDSNQW